MSKIQKLKIKIFADGANPKYMNELNNKEYIKGFTTNPTLMRKAGITDNIEGFGSLFSIFPQSG